MFKPKKILPLIVVLLFIFSVPAAAKMLEWQNPAYNFGQVKTILIKKPVFSYDYPERGTGPDKNYFEKYPHSENVIISILSKQIVKLPRYSFIHEPVANTTHTPAQQPAPPAAEFPAADITEGTLVLSIKIVDFGWYYQYYEGYWATESIDKEETIYVVDASGRLREAGKKKTTVRVPVYHPPGYRIKEFAGAEFTFSDAQTGEEVWKHIDYRDRDKSTFDKSGPESMMNRIFTAAFEKMPLAKK